MALVVKNSIESARILNTLDKNSKSQSKSLAKLSTGMKIISAQDDASGYGITECMKAQIRSLEQDIQNAQNDLSLMKTVDGAISRTIEVLRALKEKAINAANDSNTDDDRHTIQKEMDQFIDQVDDNALVTFNGKYLLDGSKNFRSENGTKTAFTNMSLHTSTTAASALTDLRARNGAHLEISSTDRVTASVVIGGKTYVSTFAVNPNALALIMDEYDEGSGMGRDGVILGSLSLENITLNDIFERLNIVTEKAGIGRVFGSANFTSKTPNNEAPIGSRPGIPGIGRGIHPEINNPNELVHAGAMIGKNAAGDAVRTSDGTTGFTVTAATIGYGYKGGQISGINISITDSQGNIKRVANSVLDAFNLSIREMNINKEDNSLNFHIGADANQSIKVGLTDMRSEALGLKGSNGTKLKVTTKEFANAAISVIDSALIKAIDQQTDIASVETRLEYTDNNLMISAENVQNSESTIRDTDMGKEVAEYARSNVLLQSAESMLAQANQNLSAVLSLLQ